MTSSNRETLLSQLRAVLDRFGKDQDPTQVLSNYATDLARHLAPTAGGDLEVLGALGWLHWYRCLCLPEGQDQQQELQTAAALLEPVYYKDPAAVPPPLREYYETREAESSGSARLSAAGAELLQQAWDSGDLHLLDTAVTTLQQAVAATSPDQPDPGLLYLFGLALGSRYERAGKRSDLDRAIEMGEAALAAIPPGHPDRTLFLSNLGSLLRTRFMVIGHVADLDRAVEVGEEAVAAIPPDDPNRAECLSKLGVALLTESEWTGRHEDLHRAVEVLEEGVAATPAGHPDRATYLTNLGLALASQSQWTQSLTDLNRAIEVGEQAVAATEPYNPDRPRYLFALGMSLGRRLAHTGLPADANRAVETLEDAVGATAPDHPDRAEYLAMLGVALHARFDRLGQAADLDRAIEIGEDALAVASPDAPQRGRYLSELGGALQKRYEGFGQVADLERAIEVGEQAVDANQQPAAQARILANLGATFMTRYQHTRHQPDLDRALEIIEEAVNASSTEDPNRSWYLASLGDALGTRYQLTGRQADLDRAIDVGEQAVNASPTDHENHSRCQSALGRNLQIRFAWTGQVADLNRAVDVSEAAVVATPPDHPLRATRLSNLGTALRTRFERTGHVADLDRAIDVGEEAAAVTPPDDPGRLLYRSNIGTALLTRFIRTGEPADLDRAIQIAAQTLHEVSNADPRRDLYLDSLGAALRTRFEVTRDLADLDQAVQVGEAAVAATPEDTSSVYLFNLADSLRTRFECTGHQADLNRAVEVFQKAAGVAAEPPVVRVQAAQWWGRCSGLAGDWVGAVQAFEVGVGLVALVAPRGLGRADQEHQLALVAGLGSEAAAACLQAADTDPGNAARWRGRAVELFEQGRGVLLAQALDNHSDLADLAVVEPDLARRFRDLVTELDRPATDYLAQQPGAGPLGVSEARAAEAQRRWKADTELAELLERIRRLEGFTTFLLPAPVERLLPVASEGLTVLVNVDRVRSDALVLSPGGVEAIRLPGLAPEAVLEQANRMLAALHTAQDPDAEPAERETAEQAMFGVLGWLWDQVAAPVLDQLGLTSTPALEQWPRVFWCPSGLLSFLPLHAAGRYHTPGQTAGTVTDRVVSSTIPTIRALHRARDAGLDNTDPQRGRLLVVAMPHTPGLGDLPGAASEAAFLASLRPGFVDILGLPGYEQATHNTVLHALRTHSWVHFACHGATDLADPSASHLVLTDHQQQPLTVLDLARARLPHPTGAFLSACSTARTGADLPDEAIHLAAACQLAGYQHVIATLWPIDDLDATLITKTFYRMITHQTPNPAVALHTATQALRANHPTHPTRWAAHAHIGP